MTMHDMGMTRKFRTTFKTPQFLTLDDTQFSTLVNCELFDPIRSKFCICHINIPGLEASAANIEAGCYPTMDQMAEMIPYVRKKPYHMADMIWFI